MRVCTLLSSVSYVFAHDIGSPMAPQRCGGRGPCFPHIGREGDTRADASVAKSEYSARSNRYGATDTSPGGSEGWLNFGLTILQDA